MTTACAAIALSMLLAGDDGTPPEAGSVLLAPWGAGHAAPSGKVYYDLKAWDDGTNTVKLLLNIINNTGHSIAVRKKCLEGSFAVRLLDAAGRTIPAIRQSGSATMGPEEYIVFDTHVHADGSYCPLSAIQKVTEMDRRRFQACDRVEISDSILGFVDDLRHPVFFAVNASFYWATNKMEKGRPTSGSSEPSQSSGR